VDERAPNPHAACGRPRRPMNGRGEALTQLAAVDAKLEALAAADARVQLLRTIGYRPDCC
jgi:hypothetical protein